MLQKINRAQYKTWLRALIEKPRKRTAGYVTDEYNDWWKREAEKVYKGEYYTRTVLLNGKPAILSRIDDEKISIREFNSLIRSFQPSTVLELGSGNGINIIAMAILNPEIKFVGLELTGGGCEASKQFIENPPIEALSYITELSETNIRKNLAIAGIQFIQGDMLNLPFEDNSFDCVFSCTAVEQLPRDYKKAFKEAHRVVSKFAFFYEGFKEAQNIFQTISRKRYDMFLGSYNDVKKIGFKIMSFRRLPVNKVRHCNALLVCRKK